MVRASFICSYSLCFAYFCPLMAANQISEQMIQDLHNYFSAHREQIPVKLNITLAEKAGDVPWLINECFAILSDPAIPERIRAMRVNLLKGIAEAMEKLKAE